ncbi:Innexin, partial [Oryctes borbonicus]
MKTIKRRMKTFEYKYGTNIVFRSGNVFTNNGTLTTHFACAVKYFSITKNSNVQKRHYCTFRKCCVIVLINFSHPFFANDELFGFLGDWRQNSTRTMMDFLNSFKSLIKLEQIHTDNNIFKLHYKFTVIILIVFSILLTSKQYFGDPINCDIEYSNKDVINTYCWIYGTYIVKNTLKEDILTGLGPDVDPRQGGPIQNFLYNERNGIITQKYYQWVCLVFCFQALLFYIPRYLWKTWEGGRLRLLAKDLGGPLIPISWSKENKERLISYMLSG